MYQQPAFPQLYQQSTAGASSLALRVLARGLSSESKASYLCSYQRIAGQVAARDSSAVCRQASAHARRRKHLSRSRPNRSHSSLAAMEMFQWSPADMPDGCFRYGGA